MLKRTEKKFKGQVIIEFTFCMIIVFLMLFTFTRVLEWTGKEFTNRRITHDTVLRSTNVKSYTTAAESEQIQQISPFFSSGTAMNAIWNN